MTAEGRIWVFHGRNEHSTRMRGVESMEPGAWEWRREPDAPVGTSASILAAIGDCVYSFGGEFTANNVTGTVHTSQVFHLPSRNWRMLETNLHAEPLDVAGVVSKHGTYGITFEDNGQRKIIAPGGVSLA